MGFMRGLFQRDTLYLLRMSCHFLPNLWIGILNERDADGVFGFRGRSGKFLSVAARKMQRFR